MYKITLLATLYRGVYDYFLLFLSFGTLLLSKNYIKCLETALKQ